MVTMNLEKQHQKLLKLMERAQNALTRKECKKILKKVQKIGRKMGDNSEI